MKVRLFAVAGAAMLALACGTSPTAVETETLRPEGGGAATVTSVTAVPTPGECRVASIGVKAYKVTPLSNDSDRRIVSLRAEYYDSTGVGLTGSCEAPQWFVSPMDNTVSLNPTRFDPFEARLVAGKGAYVITAIGPSKIYGTAKIGW